MGHGPVGLWLSVTARIAALPKDEYRVILVDAAARVKAQHARGGRAAYAHRLRLIFGAASVGTSVDATGGGRFAASDLRFVPALTFAVW